MVGGHHHGRDLGHTPGDGEGQGSLARCSPAIAKSRTRTTAPGAPQHLAKPVG